MNKDTFKTLEKVRTALLKFRAFLFYIMGNYKNLDLADIKYFCEIDQIEKTEQWKEVSFCTDYLISNLGRVKSLKGKTTKILKFRLSKGYNRIRIYNKNIEESKNYFSVHKLVISHFSKHIPSNMEKHINHKNSNILDNNISNLEYSTVRDNKIHSTLNRKYTSKFTNVNWHKALNKWRASIALQGKTIHLGYRENEVDAYNLVLEFKIKNNIITKY